MGLDVEAGVLLEVSGGFGKNRKDAVMVVSGLYLLLISLAKVFSFWAL